MGGLERGRWEGGDLHVRRRGAHREPLLEPLAVKEALHVKAQRGGPQALREREANIRKCRVASA